MGREYHGSSNSTKNSKKQESGRKVVESCVTKKSVQNVRKIKSEGFLLKRRVSPRLKSIPEDKRPYYGSAQRRRLNFSKDFCSRKFEDDNQKTQSNSGEGNAGPDKAKVDVTARRKLMQHAPKLRPEGLLSSRRVSPRFRDIPADKRPYYGCAQRRHSHDSKYRCEKETEDNNCKRQLYSPIDGSSAGRTKAGFTMAKIAVNQVQKIRSDLCLLEQSLIPRLESIPANKRPCYGRDERRQLGATEDDRKNKDDHRMRLLCTPDDNASEQKIKIDHTMQECLLHVNRKEAEDRSTESDSINGTDILHLEHAAYLEWTSCESFGDDRMHQMSGAMAREVVVGLMAVSPLMLTYKDGINFGENSCEEKNGNEAFDISKRNNIVQQYQQINSKIVLLKRRVSPRLKDIPKDKRPYYGSNRMGQLNAAKGYICKSSDQKRQSYSPKDNTTDKKTELDFSMQECLVNMAWKDVDNRDSESRLTPGSGPVKYGKTEIWDLENGEYLKALDCNKFLSDRICRKSGARVKQTVKALRRHYPYLEQDCFEPERMSKGSSILPGLVCEDLSYGEEDIHIPVTNIIDPPIAPAGFKYTNTTEVARNVSIPPSPPGCNCKGNCTNPKSCSCARLNGSDFPYVSQDGGRLIEPKDVVFECGPGCGCGPNCINRISQRGLKYRLEVYRTRNKGWAVRSWDFIPSGAPVCEYIGVLRRSADLDNVSENDFIFEIDCWHTMNGLGGRERRQGDVPLHARNLVEKMDEAGSETEFCIDGGSSGNVTRFINHSCDPNLFVQCILSSHYDIRLARIVLFAADDIPPMEELTYDYGYELDSVISPDGKVKKLPCYCGTSECRGRLY
ncbi:hypothetical protein JCGZ_23098 [Jatropha curcas]|uniref:Histone-lysine N-methyltransferase n=1 Tax=Jatropha curcas TaxID=180498 RepID=A0A067JTF5_JATCU|nr:uncharacterized protein LOC105647305 [Jatropha curcas]KDP23265.1 hypothetical protein JCGZ_23098 [Jatropha curcas]